MQTWLYLRYFLRFTFWWSVIARAISAMCLLSVGSAQLVHVPVQRPIASLALLIFVFVAATLIGRGANALNTKISN